MNLTNLIERQSPPLPWSEGDNIPWHEPGFSRRMLKEHLSQEHDAASRRSALIDRHVEWLWNNVLAQQAGRVLDLGCGPGLYASRLAKLGCTCRGIDYSPASIEYAAQQAQREHLPCTYVLEDMRTAEYGSGWDLAMQIYGEFNVFSRTDGQRILRKAHAALKPGGRLLLEAHTFEIVERMGHNNNWYTQTSGLFSESPYLVLEETFWDEQVRAATMRYYVVQLSDGSVQNYAQSLQAYTLDEYRQTLEECGFKRVAFHPDFDEPSKELFVITAEA